MGIVTSPLPVGDLSGEQQPYLRYAERLDAYDRVRSGDVSDAEFRDLVGRLDDEVAAVWGHGFRVTPVVDGATLAAAADLELSLLIKDETGNVGGSHKARHLFGVALHLLLAERAGSPVASRLAIASCGNAALGAAVVARALDRPLDVHVPTWADAAVIEALDDLGAAVNRCERQPGESGDPCHARFREGVANGATPFSVQGTDTATTFDGGRTLGWELDEQTGPLDAVYLQVGGGAFATSVATALAEQGNHAAIRPVQAEGCAPLERAWQRLEPAFDFDAAAADPDTYMWPWDDEPRSVATGILDDVTYDWLPLLRATHASGGQPVVAPEQTMVKAHALARAATPIAVSPTGSAGLAGLLHAPPTAGSRVAVAFTGVDRSVE